jgi:hypothetical protein
MMRSASGNRAIELIRSIVVSAEIEAGKDLSPGASAAIAWRTIGQIRGILTGDDATAPAQAVQASGDQIEQILHDHFYTGEPGDLERIKSAAKALRDVPQAAALPDIETVSAKVHEAWMGSKRKVGVISRKLETGEELMVPYDQLSDPAKELDRGTVRAVYEAISSLSRPKQG